MSIRETPTKRFDWHRDPITRSTPITPSYRTTQNVRRFFQAQCGPDFKFDRSFMKWIRGAAHISLGDAVDEWQRRKREQR